MVRTSNPALRSQCARAIIIMIPPMATSGSTPAGGGFARLSRSVTGLLGGLRGRESNTAHATLGIRGLAAGEIENAHFDAAALAWVAAASASASEAQLFAQAGGLIARDVPALAAGSVPPR